VIFLIDGYNLPGLPAHRKGGGCQLMVRLSNRVITNNRKLNAPGRSFIRITWVAMIFYTRRKENKNMALL